MRSHAKASPAGSSMGRASSLGHIVRGAFITRGASSDADGSGAPSQRRSLLTLSLTAALFVLAVLAASAFASKDVTTYFGNASGSGSKGGELNGPRNVAVNDSGAGPAEAGDIYVTDEANNRIQRLSSSGAFISAWGANATHRDEAQKVALNASSGTYTLSFEGDATDPISFEASAGAVDDALDALPSIGGDANVSVTSTGFGGKQTYTVTFTGALSGTNLPQMIADTSSLDGTAEVTTTENGSGGAGNSYEICTIASKCGQAVASAGNTTTAGNGSLDHPQSVAVDQDTGNVYVSDRGNRRIDEYDGEGNFIRSFGWNVVEGGALTFGSGDLSAALGIAAYGTSGDAYVSSGNEIHVFGPAPARTQSATFDGSDADAGAFEALRRIAVDQSNGTVYAIDNRAGGAVVDKFDSSGVAQDFSALGTSSLSGADVSAPDGPLAFDLGSSSDIAVDNSGTASDGRIYVLQQFGGVANFTAFSFAPDGTYLHKITLDGGDTACGIAVDSTGDVWISDLTAAKAVEYDASGAPTGTTIDTSAQNAPCHIAFDAFGNLYAGEHGEGGALYQYNSAGAFQGTIDTDPVFAVAYDPSLGRILATHSESVGEYGAQVCEGSDVCKAGSSGSGVGQYGAGGPQNGFGIAVSPADGNASTGSVFLANSGNQRVETFNLDGTSPDSFGSSSNFGEEQPRAVAVDSRGIVYASDSNSGGDVLRYDTEDANGGGVGFLAPILAPNDEVQKVEFTGFATGDKYRLTCPNGDPTVELAYVGDTEGLKVIRQGLEEACGGGSISVSGNPPETTVTFQGALGGANQPQMTCTTLSGTGSCSVATTAEGNTGPLLRGEASTATSGLAVHPDSDGGGSDADILYVLRDPSQGNTVVQQFGPSHAPGLTVAPTAVDDTHGANAGFSAVQGLGLNSASGNLYVSATNEVGGLGAAHRVYVLGDGSSLSAPVINQFGVSANADRSATFSATLNPNGALAACKVQYSTDEFSWTEVNVPACNALAINGGFQPVTQEATGLVPNTEYFARLQVSRPFFPALAPLTSSVVSFTTDPAAPAVTKAVAKAVDDTSVRVSATVDPAHSPTSYVIEYGLTPSLGSSSAPISIGEGSSPVEVSSLVSGLKPATTYYFKLVATNLTGSTASPGLKAATFTTTPGFGSCPNDQFRTGPSAKLPDCRAYEQASPTDKYGSDTHGTTYTVQASPSGDGVTFFTATAFPGGEGFQEKPAYLLSFAGGKWSTHGLLPPPSLGDKAAILAWTGDLDLTFTKSFESARGFIENKLGYNMVLRDSSDGSRTVLVPQERESSEFVLDGTFDGNSKIVFSANGPIPVTSGPSGTARTNTYLYDRDTGELTLVGVLPGSSCASPPCVPTSGSSVPPVSGVYYQEGHAVTPSGDVYFVDKANVQVENFSASPPTGKLYLRRDAAGPGATTDFVSASHKTNGAGPGGSDPSGPQPVLFMGATPSNSRAFFASPEELTDDAQTGPISTIARADLNGANASLTFTPAAARSIAVNGAHVYWTIPQQNAIGRADIGGANPDPTFITGVDKPQYVAADASHVYWTSPGGGVNGQGTIGRAGLDGSGNLVPGSVEPSFITGASNPQGIAVSATNIYWANVGTTGATRKLGRATLAGGSVTQALTSNNSTASAADAEQGATPGLALDGTYIYWGKGANITRASLPNASGANASFISETGSKVDSVAVNSSYLFWTNPSRGLIGRAAADGSGANSSFLKDVPNPQGVAADAGHLYWSNQTGDQNNDLYAYDPSSGDLTDLVPGAEVMGVAGYSDDGSYVYFAANADIDGGGPAQPGNCEPNSGGGVFTPLHCSLYLWQADGAGSCASTGGCVTFVAPLEGEEGGRFNWAGAFQNGGMKTSRVSTDGHTLVFASQRKLTAYDNFGPHCEPSGFEYQPGSCNEFYRYEADSGQLTCLTCDPTGVAPDYEATIKNPNLNHCGGCILPTMNSQPFVSRNLSPDGKRFFFQSPNKLVPADVNGDASCPVSDRSLGTGPACLDVYEWEAPGKGTCTTQSSAYSPSNGGCIYLISTGTGSYPTFLGDVSASGDTAFLLTRDRLVPSDGDVQEDIYAVKVDGGLAYQHAVRPAACEGDACRGGASQAADTQGAGSAVFDGPGNPKSGQNKTRCPKGKRQVHTKGKVRCVAKHRKPRKHKRAANHNRRASR